MINNIEEHEKKMHECCESCKPINDDPCEEIFNIMSYAVLIRLCVDILEEAYIVINQIEDEEQQRKEAERLAKKDKKNK